MCLYIFHCTDIKNCKQNILFFFPDRWREIDTRSCLKHCICLRVSVAIYSSARQTALKGVRRMSCKTSACVLTHHIYYLFELFRTCGTLSSTKKLRNPLKTHLCSVRFTKGFCCRLNYIKALFFIFIIFDKNFIAVIGENKIKYSQET